jgi:DNA-directed RNA polymerase specialized sigma24 family protein
MDEVSSPPEGSKSIVRRLKSSTASGKNYSRTSTVDDQIQRVLRLHQSEWTREAPDLKTETIVFLMRLVRRADEQLFYEFFKELSARIVRIANRGASRYRLKPEVVQEIVEDVELQVLQLVLDETSSRKTDFLEVAFGAAVKCRALNRARKHNNSVQAHLGWIEVPSDYDDSVADKAIEPLELTPDSRPSPEAIAIKKVLLDKAWAVIDDPRIYQALFLHYYEGWPVEELMDFFGGTRRHVKYMLEKGLRQMRDAIGEGK